MMALRKYTLIALLAHFPLVAELDVCDGIPFKKHVHLPCEQKRESPCGLRTLFLPRSPGSNTARHLAGWYEYLPGCDDRVWGNLGCTIEYSHSFKSKHIAQYLFGSTCLHFSGSQVPHRKKTDLLADNFGLPTNFKGTVCFKPEIKDIIVEILLHIGLDEWYDGLYFKTYFPIVHAKWDLGLHCNEVNNIPLTTIPTFPQCYMASTAVDAVQNIRSALSGRATFGDMKVPIMFGELNCGRRHGADTGVGDIEVYLGWNPLLTCDAHAGLYFITVVPTSNIPTAAHIFEPILGNGHLWEAGAGVSAHWNFFRKGCQSLGIFFEGHVTHQFRTYQIRSFDFKKHGPLSRYLLLKEFNSDMMYRGSLLNAIDFATHAAYVGGSTKIDASAKLSYYYGEWGLDLGYNIYFKDKETIHIQKNLFPSDFNNRFLGIKGTEGVCARVFDTATGTLTNKTVPLNSTQNSATITHAGKVDNPTQVPGLGPNEVAITWDSSLDPAHLKIAHDSKPAVRLTLKELNPHSGSVPRQLTHKVFGHISYTALNLPWEPQFGVGGEAEFDGHPRTLSALNQWGVWVKGTWSF